MLHAKLAALALWGGYLLYICVEPAMVPAWAHAPGFRRALLLDIAFRPTLFTLVFGLGFSLIAVAGCIRFATRRFD